VPKRTEEDFWWWFRDLLSELNEKPIHPGYRNTYGYIYGACLALQESMIHLRNSDMAVVTDRMELLPKGDFDAVVQKDGYVKWKRDKVARLYACEFYLNKAQANIAAAVDSILNQWMIDKLPGPYRGNIERVSFDVMYLLFTTRLGIVSGIRKVQTRIGQTQASSPIFDNLESELSRLGNLYDTKVASAVLEENKHRVNAWIRGGDLRCLFPPREGGMETLGYTDRKGVTRPIGMLPALAILCARVNAFKHLPTGHDDRSKEYHYTEWALSTRALLCVRELFRDKVASVPEGPTPLTQEE
jgi:hypothetical protein